MMLRFGLVFASLLLTFHFDLVFAEQNIAAASGVAAAAIESPDDWVGDTLKIKSNVKTLHTKDSSTDCHFAPAYTKFTVTQYKDGKLTLTANDNVEIDERTHNYSVPHYSGLGWFAETTGKVPDTPDTCPLISPYDQYTIAKSDIESASYTRYGWMAGALIVPFKYQLQSKVLTSSSTFQLYMGYKRESNSNKEGPFVSLGVVMADIPTGAGTSTNKTGYSYGIGWLFTVKKDSGMQLMLLWGQDRFGANSGYPYEGDTWLSTSIGIGF